MSENGSRFLSVQLDRRLVGLCAALVVGACGGGDEGSSEPRQVQRSSDPFCEALYPNVDAYMASVANQRATGERYGGTVVVGAPAELAGGMSSLISPDFAANQHHMFVNLMPLIRYNADYDPEPYLAESWDVSDDGTEITFHLRQDVFWHDGTPTTANDVAFTVRRAMDPETPFPNDGFFASYDAEGVEVVDTYTVRVRLEPHNEFMDVWRYLGIMPAHLLESVPAGELRDHPYNTQCPVGNGPFVFEEHLAADRWSFVANPGFPEGAGGQPFVDRYVYRVIPEQTTLYSELLTGGIDSYISPLPEQAVQIQEHEDLDLHTYQSRNYSVVAWNGRVEKLSDVRVRKAITMATDRAGILQALRLGMGTIANATVAPYHWAYDESVEPLYPYDPDGARALLAEAGWEDRDGDGVVENAAGEPLSITVKTNPNQEREDVAEIMQAQLAEVGIQLNVELVEWGTLAGEITSVERPFEGVLLGFASEFRVDDTDLFRSDRNDHIYAFSGTNDAGLDELLRRIPTVLDRDEARGLIQEYQHALAEVHPFTFLYFPDRTNGVNKRLQGVELDVRGDWVSIADWWIPADQRR